MTEILAHEQPVTYGTRGAYIDTLIDIYHALSGRCNK